MKIQQNLYILFYRRPQQYILCYLSKLIDRFPLICPKLSAPNKSRLQNIGNLSRSLYYNNMGTILGSMDSIYCTCKSIAYKFEQLNDSQLPLIFFMATAILPQLKSINNSDTHPANFRFFLYGNSMANSQHNQAPSTSDKVYLCITVCLLCLLSCFDIPFAPFAIHMDH